MQDLEERIEELESAGVEGASAYEVAAQNGFNGTKEEWLDSLVGPQGISGPAGADGLTTSVNFVEQVVGNISLTCDDIPEKRKTRRNCIIRRSGWTGGFMRRSSTT
ncbi:hypothetical protein SDC9_151429 [bioreactor metagenome]|uniref:Uncharacterized protein n=1 Tax=bioreactor metagenome TaxID=1076179 RepID=A0A645EUK6_9ZZZZ